MSTNTNTFLKTVTTGQFMEFCRIFGEMGLGNREMEAILSGDKSAIKIAEFCAKATGGTLAYPETAGRRDYSQFDSHLISLADQRDLLTSYLSKFAKKLKISKESLASLKAKLEGWKSDSFVPVQTITNCQTLIVWLGDLRKTLRFYQLVVEDRQKEAGANGIREWVDFTTLPMELNGTAYQGYGTEPGVYLADGINLVDNWDPENGSSVDQARQGAKERQDYFLASIEALATYAVAKPELYQAQNGVNLPCYDMAGIKSGVGLGKSPYSSWDADGRRVCFYSGWSSSVCSDCARPSLRSVTRV